MIDPEEEIEGATRRAFMVAMAAFGVTSLAGCAGKGKKSEEPQTANAQFGSALDGIDKRLKETISDKKRRKAVKEIAERATQKIVRLGEIISDWRDDLRRLSDVEKRDQAVIDGLTDKYNNQMREELVATCELAVEARQFITREEWPRIFPPPDQTSAALPSTWELLGGAAC